MPATCTLAPLIRPLASANAADRKSTRLNSSHDQISYAVFCLKKKKKSRRRLHTPTHNGLRCRSRRRPQDPLQRAGRDIPQTDDMRGDDKTRNNAVTNTSASLT